MMCSPSFLQFGKAKTFLEIIFQFILYKCCCLTPQQISSSFIEVRRSEASVETKKAQFCWYCFGEQLCSCCLLMPKALSGAINNTHLSPPSFHPSVALPTSWPFCSVPPPLALTECCHFPSPRAGEEMWDAVVFGSLCQVTCYPSLESNTGLVLGLLQLHSLRALLTSTPDLAHPNCLEDWHLTKANWLLKKADVFHFSLPRFFTL